MSDSAGPQIRISELSEELGYAEELPPKEKARYQLAAWFLLGLAFLTIFVAALLAWGPGDRIEQLEELFSFVKATVPPLVTLVIGFYFQANNS